MRKACVKKSKTCGWIAKVPRPDGTWKSVPCGSWEKCMVFAEWYMGRRVKWQR